ncbi:hypothetical protein CMV16_13985 [Peribacillus simplex]|jgi:uncharacterized protein (DUF2225 family)|nr:hypothetical protein CMV16_13985 [Peribacillus simplex]
MHSLRLFLFRGFFPVLPPSTMEIILEKVSSHWVPHHFSKERSIKDAINTYKLASYCGALKKEKHIILAGICLRIAWLYRIKQNMEQEERFLSSP